MRTIVFVVLLMLAGAAAHAQAPADATAVPAYLEDLRKLAEARLAEGETEFTAAPLARRVNGPVTRAEYEQYVGESRFRGRVEPDSVAMTRPVIPRVVIRDRQAIGYLFSCCAYDETAPDSIAFIEIYDVSRSGFSNGDMMVVHPSGHSYILEGLDAEFLESAAGWEMSDKLRFRAFHRENAWMDELVEGLEVPATDDWTAARPDLDAAANEDQALRAIWGGLHRAVEGQYGEGRLELHFARDDTTTTVEFWGYDPRRLDFNWLDFGQGAGGTDLLTVTIADTLTTTYRTMVDVLVVKETSRDTLYVPGR